MNLCKHARLGDLGGMMDHTKYTRTYVHASLYFADKEEVAKQMAEHAEHAKETYPLTIKIGDKERRFTVDEFCALVEDAQDGPSLAFAKHRGIKVEDIEYDGAAFGDFEAGARWQASRKVTQCACDSPAWCKKYGQCHRVTTGFEPLGQAAPSDLHAAIMAVRCDPQGSTLQLRQHYLDGFCDAHEKITKLVANASKLQCLAESAAILEGIETRRLERDANLGLIAKPVPANAIHQYRRKSSTHWVDTTEAQATNMKKQMDADLWEYRVVYSAPVPVSEPHPLIMMLRLPKGDLAQNYGYSETVYSLDEIESVRESAAKIAAHFAPVQTAVADMVQVAKQDGNDYCRILSILGMEEDGDPVAEVQRLFDLASTPAKTAVIVPDEVRNALASYNEDSTNPRAHAFVCIVEDWLELLNARP